VVVEVEVVWWFSLSHTRTRSCPPSHTHLSSYTFSLSLSLSQTLLFLLFASLGLFFSQVGSQDLNLLSVYVPTNHVYIGDIFMMEEKVGGPSYVLFLCVSSQPPCQPCDLFHF
jgi:hypothetical protein